MLNWLAGVPHAAVDGEGASQDEKNNYTCIDDAPTTPAPVFAARAFKHMIWGTPKPEEIQNQRERPRRRTSRPGGLDAASAARTRASKNEEQYANLSPAKRAGILVTPGTGGTRRKTVSFEKKVPPLQFGATPRDIPGKFPTPGPTKDEIANADRVGAAPAKSLAGTCVDILHVDKHKESTARLQKPISDDFTLNMDAPRSTSGRYWKTEYETYTSKSSVEMRKLAKKEQMAKSYAKHRDLEATGLSEQLQQEQHRVAELEKQLAEYVTKLSVAVKDKHIGAETTRTSPISSEMKEMEMSLTTADALIESLQQTNATLKTRIYQVESDNLSLRSRLGIQHDSKTAKLAPPSPAPELDSDIWADVGNATVGSHLTSKSHHQPSKRSPLRRRDVNLGEVIDADRSTKCQGSQGPLEARTVLDVREEKTEAPTHKGLSDERKEAARRRLEERKRNRERNSGVVGEV